MASLALFFVITITGNVLANTLRRLEWILHGVPIIFSLATSIFGVVTDNYNAVRYGIGCWYAPYPPDCLEEGSEKECIRGANSETYQVYFGMIPVAYSLLTVLVSMFAIYCKARSQLSQIEAKLNGRDDLGGIEPEDAEPNSCSQEEGNHDLSREFEDEGYYDDQFYYDDDDELPTLRKLREKVQMTRWQGMAYILSFLLTYLFTGVTRATEGGADRNSWTMFSFSLGSQIFLPLQGFMNFFIYVHPKFVSLRRREPEWTAWDVYDEILFRSNPYSINTSLPRSYRRSQQRAVRSREGLQQQQQLSR